MQVLRGLPAYITLSYTYSRTRNTQIIGRMSRLIAIITTSSLKPLFFFHQSSRRGPVNFRSFISRFQPINLKFLHSKSTSTTDDPVDASNLLEMMPLGEALASMCT